MKYPEPGAAGQIMRVIEEREFSHVVVIDGSADEYIKKMVAEGWTLEDRVDYAGGKRIRSLVPPKETSDV